MLPTILLGILASSTPALAQFTDRTAERGLAYFQTTWSAAIADFDGDGHLDILGGHHLEPPILWWNDGTGSFDSTIHPQPWSGPIDRHGVLAVSLDLDSDPEIFFTHGGAGGGGSEANELYRNDGGGSFISLLSVGGMGDGGGRSRCASAADYNGDFQPDVWIGKAPDGSSPNRLYRNDLPFWLNEVGASVGLAETDGTNGGLWADVDDDGDPDLLVGGEEFPRPTRLYRNDGGIFVDGSAVFSPALPTVSGADFGDYDNDGDLDLAVCDGQLGIFDAVAPGENPVTWFFNTRYGDSGLDGLTITSVSDTATGEFQLRGEDDPSRVYLGPSEVNPAPGTITLTDDYVGAPVFNPGVEQGTWVWRSSPGGPWEIRTSTPFTNFDTFNGWLAQKTVSPLVIPVSLESAGFSSGAPRVWRNDGGTFTEVSGALGLPASLVNPRDISWVDFDNDGDLDLHVVDKGTSAVPNAPDRLYRNDGASFVDVSSAQKITGSSTGLGDGALWADLDEDGDLDLYLREGAGPTYYSGQGPSRLLDNEGGHGPALFLDLVGRESGAVAIGTRVTAVAGALRVHRRVQANSWQGLQDPMRLHLGLGGAAVADSVLVEWPSGIVDVHLGLPAGLWLLNEGEVETGAPEIDGPRAGGWGLSAPAPEPARGEQRFLLSASRGVALDVTVHDVRGRVVRRLHGGELSGGVTALVWDGRDDRGRRVTSGVYFVRADDGRLRSTRKATRLH